MKKAVWGAFLLMTTLAAAGLCEMDYTLSNPHIRYEKIEGERQEEAAQADSASISLSDMAAAEDAQPAAQTVLDAMGVGRLVQNTGAYSFGTDVLVILGKDWKPSS